MRSSRIIAITTPAGPIFFWTPPYITAYFETSTGSDKKHEDTSATKSFPFVLGSFLYFVQIGRASCRERV